MSNKNEEKQKLELEESKMTPPDDFGADEELKTEEQEAIEAIRKFTDEGRWVCTNGVEVAKDDRFEGSTRVDVILDDFLVHLLRVAIRRERFLNGSLLGHRKVLWCWLTIHST
jgi:hypothetical protein